MNVFGHHDLKSYLKSAISRLPKKGRGEVTRIARAVNVSTTMVSLVLSGEKTFTAEQTQALVLYLGLGDLEGKYLIYLVQRERAGSRELKNFWQERLDEIKKQTLIIANRVASDQKLTEENRTVFYSDPMYSAIRLFSSVGGKGKTASEISERFELPKARTAKMLSFLTSTGLCAEKNGRYQMGVQKTHLEQSSPQLSRHLCNWRLKGIQSHDKLTPEELMYTAPVSLSKKDFESLR